MNDRALHPIVSRPLQARFLTIPQAPLCYWLRERFFELLAGRTLGDAAKVVQQVITADNERFLRFRWEIGEGSQHWVGYLKAGGYARWAGFDQMLLDWRGDGAVLKSAIVEKYPYLNGNWSWLVKEETFFRRGWTYTLMARGCFAARSFDGHSVCDSASPTIVLEEDICGLGSLLNCRFSSFMLRSLSTDLKFRENYVARLPLPERIPASLAGHEAACVALKRYLVALDPTERTFTERRTTGATLVEASRVVADMAEAVAAVLHSLEGLSEREVFAAYGIAGEELQAVLDETGTPAGWYPVIAGNDALPALPTELRVPDELHARLAQHERRALAPEKLARLKVRLRALYDAGPGANVEAEEEANANGEGEDDGQVALGARIPMPAETFLEELSQKLELHPISVCCLLKEMRDQEGLVSPPEVKRQFEDYVSVTVLRQLGYRWPEQDGYEKEHGPILDPSLVVEDGIIPLVRCGDEPTAEERVRARLERDFGEDGAAESLRELRQYVGRELGEWLRREFFKRHLRQFKQRPIAWHLVSPERTFEAFILYHKLSRATLQTVRTRYAGRLIDRLRGEQARARERKDEAAVGRLQLQIEDVEDLRGRLEAIERGDELKHRIRCRWKGETETGRPGPYAPDIDDGVKVNIRPFQEAGLLAVRQVIKKW